MAPKTIAGLALEVWRASGERTEKRLRWLADHFAAMYQADHGLIEQLALNGRPAHERTESGRRSGQKTE